MITVINLQRKIKIAVNTYRTFSSDLTSVVPEARGKRFTVAFVPDSRMEQLNTIFRGKGMTTDVLSFPHEPDDFDPDENNLGDIVISAAQALKQSAENGLSLETEIKQLILHGLLHLVGMNHETDRGEMNVRELDVRCRLGIE